MEVNWAHASIFLDVSIQWTAREEKFLIAHLDSENDEEIIKQQQQQQHRQNNEICLFSMRLPVFAIVWWDNIQSTSTKKCNQTQNG